MTSGPLGTIGRMLLGAGALVALVGLVLVLADRWPWLRLGRLPGDLSFGRGNVRFYFPLGTSILLSVILSLALWLFSRR